MNPQHYATYNPQQQQFYARNNSGNLGAYATQSGMSAPPVGGTVPLHAWTPPSPPEQQYYDVLFAHADEQRRNAIGGQQAVAFFTRSHLDKAVLREVWSIADSQRRSELSRNEFYVAMRLIAMAQRGDQLSVQRFYQVAAMPYPLPMMEGIQPQQGVHPGGNGMPPVPPPAQSHVQQQDFGHHAPTSGGGTSYALTADEKSKYDIVFQQYDTDRDGFLMGPEAVALFQMSGLDRTMLRDIWSMADATQDSKLSIQEFYVAMHLIVCVSKRRLPMPSTLPRELAETAFGTDGALLGMPTHQGQMPATQAQNGFAGQAQEPAPAPKPEGMSAFDSAFDSLSTMDDSPLPTLSTSTPRSSRAGSFNQGDTSGGFPTVTGHQEFNNISSSQTLSTNSAPGRDRTNSASSLNSMSSFSGMAPHQPLQPPHSQHSSQQLPPRSLGSNERIQMTPRADGAGFQPLSQGYPGMPGFGAGGFDAPQAPITASERPFMSDDEERRVVCQLDQQNEEVVQTLAGVERTQTAIEMLSEKLHDLDELRHELVSLVTKRESMRVKLASDPVVGGDPAEERTRRAVEHSLRSLVENEQQIIHQLQCDVSRYEGELEEAILSAKLQQKMSIESRSPLIDASSPSRSGADGSDTFNAFGAPPLSLDGSTNSVAAAPGAPFISPFSPGPSPDATDSSGFNAFSNFDSAPRSIGSATPSPAAAIQAPSGSPFSPSPSPSQQATENDVFGDFSGVPPSAMDTTLSHLPAAINAAPGNSPFSPIPSPAVDSKNSLDAFDAAPLSATPSSLAITADVPEHSPFSTSPAATNDSGSGGFGDFNTAPSSYAASADAPEKPLFSSSPSAAAASGNDFGSEPAASDSAIPSLSPVAKTDTVESSPFSPLPVPTTASNNLLGNFAAAPASNDKAGMSTPVQAANTSGNSPFSPVATDKNDVDAFGDFSAASTSTESVPTSFTPPKPMEVPASSPFSPSPSPAAAAPISEFDTFGDFNAASGDSATLTISAPASTTNAPETQPFSPSPSPAAATDNSFDTFGENSAAPVSSDSATQSSMPGATNVHESLPFSPTPSPAVVPESSSSDDFDFSAPVSSDSAETSSTPAKSAEASVNSLFSPVAKDNSGFDSFGDFNIAPTPADSGFEAFGDFSAAPATTDSAAEKDTTAFSPFSPTASPVATTVSNGFGEVGDFSAAPSESTSSDGFGSFNAEPAK